MDSLVYKMSTILLYGTTLVYTRLLATGRLFATTSSFREAELVMEGRDYRMEEVGSVNIA